MNRGRPGAVLSPHDRHRLRTFRKRHGNYLGVHLGLPALRMAMQAPFTWETLQRALQGLPVSPETRQWIIAFLDREDPPRRAPMDFKSRAAGEREEESEQAPGKGRCERETNGEGRETDERNEKDSGAARTVRGSR